MQHSLETRIWFLIIFLPLKASLTLFQTWIFCWSSIILSHLELSRIDLQNLTSSILLGTVTILVALVDEFCFYIHHPIKVWLSAKVFELQSVTKFTGKTAIWTFLCFSPLTPLNNVDEQWVKLALSNVMGFQHCIGAEGKF